MKKILALLIFLVLLSPQLAFAAACSSTTDHLAAYYKMDGNSNDAVHTNNGTDTSISYSTTNAVINQAAQFGGASKIKIPSGTDFTSPTTGISMAAWVYNTTSWTSPAIQTIVAKIDGVGTPGTYVRINMQGAQKLSATSDGDNHTIAGGTTLAINTRYFVVMSYDGTTLSLYLNGTKDASDLTYSAAVTPGTGSVAIGELGDFDTAQFFAGGAIDEVGYWTCGLTSAQVTTLYNSGNGLQYPFTVANPAKFTFWQFMDF